MGLTPPAQKGCNYDQINTVFVVDRCSGGSAARTRLNVEQIEHIVLSQAQRRRRAILLDQFVEQLALLFQHYMDAAFDSGLADEARHKHRRLLAQTMGTIDGLVLDSRV